MSVYQDIDYVATPSPCDEDFDDMHHALGRPSDAFAGYRNHYCTETGGMTAARFEALGWWTKGRAINDGRDTIYAVNEVGRKALSDWLNARRALEAKEPQT